MKQLLEFIGLWLYLAVGLAVIIGVMFVGLWAIEWLFRYGPVWARWPLGIGGTALIMAVISYDWQHPR